MKELKTNLHFGLVAYNARDFGYNFLYLSPRFSSNIENSHKGKDVVEIKQYIHTGDSSSVSWRLQQHEPLAMDEIDRLRISALPATCNDSHFGSHDRRSTTSLPISVLFWTSNKAKSKLVSRDSAMFYPTSKISRRKL